LQFGIWADLLAKEQIPMGNSYAYLVAALVFGSVIGLLTPVLRLNAVSWTQQAGRRLAERL